MCRRMILCLLPALLLAFHAAAQDFDGGLAAYKRGDYANALKVFKPLAAGGHAQAQYHLGLMYEYGWGVKRDYSRAASWYRKAAEQGDTGAQLNLDFIYLNGRAAPPQQVRPGPVLRRPIAPGATVLEEAPAPAETAPQESRDAAVKAFRVQLSSVKSRTDAEKEAERLSRVHGAVLDGADIALVRVDLGSKGVYYRLRAGPMPDRHAANSVCEKLSAGNQSCLVIAP